MIKIIEEDFKDSIEVTNLSYQTIAKSINSLFKLILDTYNSNGKLVIMGNGGSSSDAQHFAAELVGKYFEIRKPLPAIAITSDTAVITCISNDFGYENIFSRQIECLANKNDLVVGISTSGKSNNVLNGLRTAKKKYCKTALLTGDSFADNTLDIDLIIKVPSRNTARIQEVHGLIIHIICNLLDKVKPL